MADNKAEFRVVFQDGAGGAAGKPPEKTPGLGIGGQQGQPTASESSGAAAAPQALNQAAQNVSAAAQSMSASAAKLASAVSGAPTASTAAKPGSPLNPLPPAFSPPGQRPYHLAPYGPPRPPVPPAPPAPPQPPRARSTPLLQGMDYLQFAANVAAATGMRVPAQIISSGILGYQGVQNASPAIQRAGRTAGVALGRAAQQFAATAAANPGTITAAANNAAASIAGAGSQIALNAAKMAGPLAIAAGAVGAFAAATHIASSLVKQQTDSVARFSTQIQYVNAVSDVRDMLQSLRNAQRYGSVFANAEESSRDLGRAWDNARTTVAGKLAPSIGTLNRGISSGLNIVTGMLGGTPEESLGDSLKGIGKSLAVGAAASQGFMFGGPAGAAMVAGWMEKLIGNTGSIKKNTKNPDVSWINNEFFFGARVPLWNAPGIAPPAPPPFPGGP